jgi:hypothetical protein
MVVILSGNFSGGKRALTIKKNENLFLSQSPQRRKEYMIHVPRSQD